MNTKHIEQITSEQIIGEIQHLSLDDNMLTTALSKPYADATGLPEVQPSAPVTSDVEEMPSWMTYMLRKMFSTTATVFRGLSLLSGFRAVYGWLRERLKGSEDYYIPPVTLDPSKQISEHLRLLDNRRIDCPNAPDGISLACLLFSVHNNDITELLDTNIGWRFEKSITNEPFPNLKSIVLNCKSVLTGTHTSGIVKDIPNLERLELPELEGDVTFIINGQNKVQSLYLPNIKNVLADLPNLPGGRNCIEYTEIEELYCGAIGCTHTNNYHTSLIANCSTIKRLICPNYVRPTYGAIFKECPNLEYVYIPSTIAISRIGYDGNNISNLQNLHTFIAGGFQQEYYSGEDDDTRYGSFKDCPNLIHLEFAKTCDMSTDIRNWSPTNALDDRLPEFLYNFQTYIAERLADMTGKTALTLTLSSAVYAALEAQEGQTILATLANKNWTVAQA